MMMSADSTTYPCVLLTTSDDGLALACDDALAAYFGRRCVLRYPDARSAAANGLRGVDVAIAAPAPDAVGPEVSRLVAARADLPVIVLLGPGDAAGAVEAVEAGAADASAVDPRDALWAEAVLPVQIEKVLAASLGRGEAELEAARLRAECGRLRAEKAMLEQRVAQLEAMAWTDPLTGLANRRQVEDRLTQMFAEAARYGADLACLMIDLDGFKAVNDRHGHAEGDRMLRAMGRLIEQQIRASDIAARYGGDEFVVLMPRSGCTTAARVAQRLKAAFSEIARTRPSSAGRECGVSIGIACLRRNGPLDGAGLIAMADAAMYASKRGGRNRVMICAPDGGYDEAAVDPAEDPTIEPA